MALVLCGLAVPAHADYLFTPFLGGAFGGSTVFHTERPEGSAESLGTHLIFGGAAGWLSSGFLGVEGDFAYAPRFFERDGQIVLSQIVLSSTVATVSGSVIVATPLRVTGYSLRPYLIGGLGLIHTGIMYTAHIVDPVDDNSLGMNLGAGAIGLLSPRTGVRFELRHFRTLSRDANETTGERDARLSFWRVTIGVIIKR
jgi:hypothetical protein